MMEGKVCPMMAQGWIAGYNVTAVQWFKMDRNERKLPRCLKENCALWKQVQLEETSRSGKTGYCGLINQQTHTNWSPV